MRIFMSLLTTITFCILFVLFELYAVVMFGSMDDPIEHLQYILQFGAVWKALLIPAVIPSFIAGIGLFLLLRSKNV